MNPLSDLYIGGLFGIGLVLTAMLLIWISKLIQARPAQFLLREVLAFAALVAAFITTVWMFARFFQW